MRIAVVAGDQTKAAWLACGVQPAAELVWLEKPAVVPGAAAYIDLEFSNFPNRLAAWEPCSGALVIINDVLKEAEQLPPQFVRFNGWPSFLEMPVAEAAAPAAIREEAAAVFASFNRTVEWVADVPGFISARVICMIINEAWYTLEEGVSTREEIDTAMKLGTNYPAGPFEWAKKIGILAVCQLLDKLSVTNHRYLPAGSLKDEALLK